MSAENNNPSSPADGAPDDAAEPSNHDAETAPAGVVTSHGEREKRAYVAPVQVPRRHQRLNTIDMSKVRISPDMKVQHLDPRNMQTQKMDVPPGGFRPPPPPASAEIADAPSRPGGAAPAQPPPAPGGSPWSQNAGLDRSMLPSAAMAQGSSGQAARVPSMPPPMSQSSSGSSISPAIWIAVVLVAALLGGGVALALRGGGSGSNADPASSATPIAIQAPENGTTTNGDTAGEPEVVDPNSANSAQNVGSGATSTKSPTIKTVPKRTSPAPKTTAAPAPAPAPTTTLRPRLFN